MIIAKAFFLFLCSVTLKLSHQTVECSLSNTTAKFAYRTKSDSNGTPSTVLAATTASPWPDCQQLNCSCESTSIGWNVECSGDGIEQVPQRLPKELISLKLLSTKVKRLVMTSFANYTKLRKLVIDQDTALHHVEPLLFTYTPDLKFLEITNCIGLEALDEGVLYRFTSLTHLVVTDTGLKDLPHMGVFSADHGLTEVDFSRNRNIKTLKKRSLERVKTFTLRLTQTGLEKIEDGAFQNTDITRLFLSHNPDLTTIEDNAFKGMELRFLDLSSTSITKLPTIGLDTLRELTLKNTPTLKRIPPVVKFLDLKIAEVTFPHHCCAFKNPDKQDPSAWKEYQARQAKIQRMCASTLGTTTTVSQSTHKGYRVKRFADGFGTISEFFSIDDSGGEEASTGFGGIVPPKGGNTDTGLGGFGNGGFGDGGFGGGVSIPTVPFLNSPPPTVKVVTENTIFHNETRSINDDFDLVKCGVLIYRQYAVTNCTPEPNAWNPCEDVLGYDWLRVFIWIVLLAAILGNFAVIVVIISNRNKMTVPKFLMCNLSFADCMMGVYLLLIASIDANTLGEYFNYAVHWQNGGGCQAAGFLTVFASELSIYTLAVITLERWYAISYAIHLNKRLRLKQATIVMAFGWAFALIMSGLPLSDTISSYATTSICLPFKFDSALDKGYVFFIIVVNGLAFVAVCGCYTSMFVQVYGNSSNAPGSDATIAKRMAILVFTDFACYAPIAFFALTAAGGLVLINITNSKVLLVFFYPLNSCANPFLYAIFTKQFRKDLFMLLSRYGFCQQRAAKYKETYISGGASVTQSRNSMPLHQIRHNPSDGSILTQYIEVPYTRNSRPSLSHSPSNTPKQQKTSPRISPKLNGGFRHSVGSFSTSPSSKKKLSVVREKGPKSESNNASTCQEQIEEKYIDSDFGRAESVGDDEIFDGDKVLQNSGSRVRSASQYAESNNAAFNMPSKKQNRHVSQDTDISLLSSESGDEDFRKTSQNGAVIIPNGISKCKEDSYVSSPAKDDKEEKTVDQESGYHSSASSPESRVTNNNDNSYGKYAGKSTNRKEADDIKKSSPEEFVEKLLQSPKTVGVTEV